MMLECYITINEVGLVLYGGHISLLSVAEEDRKTGTENPVTFQNKRPL